MAERLPQALVRLGYQDQSRSTRVLEFLGPEEDSFVVVPSTGRVELRLFYLTAHGERRARAERLRSILEHELSNAS